MNIAIGSDHRGFAIKQRILLNLQQMGHDVCDVGTQSTTSVDYPDYAFQVATMVAQGKVERGVLICGTGIGMSIAANKVPGVRAAPCHDTISAEVSRRHNDANILCISADMLGEELIDQMVRSWLHTEFEGGRHARRVEKIVKYEHESHPQS